MPTAASRKPGAPDELTAENPARLRRNRIKFGFSRKERKERKEQRPSLFAAFAISAVTLLRLRKNGREYLHQTAQSFTAARSDVSGSRFGKNSWPTKPLNPVALIARMIGG